MDQSDLHDYEIAQIAQIWQRLQSQFSRRVNSRQNLEEFARVAHDTFLRAGFVVNVQWENSLIINPMTMQPYPTTIEVMGRVAEPKEGFDHERKRHEVLLSRDRNESFLGQKEGRVIR